MNKDTLSSQKKLSSHFLSPYYGLFVFLILLTTLSVITSELIPWYSSQIINLVNSSTDKADALTSFMPLFIKLFICSVSANIFSLLSLLILQYKCLSWSGIRIRQELFNLILRKNNSFWNIYPAGDIWEKIDLTRRTLAAFSSLGQLLYSGYAVFLSMLIMCGLLYCIYPPLMLIFIFSGLLTLCIFNFITNNIKKPSAQLAKIQTRTAGKIVNLISNFFILKIFATEKREQMRLKHHTNYLVKALKKNHLIETKHQFILNLLTLCFQCFMIIYAVYLWTEKIINIGDIIFVITATKTFSNHLSSFGWTIPFFKSRSAILEKNLVAFSYPDEINLHSPKNKIKITSGQIEIRNLTFSYPHKKPVLSNLNLTIKAKEKVGIVGVSGGGKTTLLYLIQSLLNTPKNSIFIDGQDVTTINQESLRQVISFIPQDTSLFHRTVMENLQYGHFMAAKDKVISAAQTAFADVFINQFPQKYETLVGDKGAKLSGGERQRIGIARAVLRNAPILILDEATSALDSQSEAYIQKAFDTLTQNKTVIAVAHRLSTLKNMDRIIVLQDGKIVEQGKPSELIDKNGTFALLWHSQQD